MGHRHIPIRGTGELIAIPLSKLFGVTYDVDEDDPKTSGECTSSVTVPYTGQKSRNYASKC